MEYRVRDSAPRRFLSRAARAVHSARPSVACGALADARGGDARAGVVLAPGAEPASGTPGAARTGSPVGSAPPEAGRAVASSEGALVGTARVGAAAASSAAPRGEDTGPERKKRTAPTTTTRMASSHPNTVPGPIPERPGGVSISDSAGIES